MSKLILGIEFGSTIIKSILIDENGKILSDGSFTYENQIINDYFSYPLELIIKGMQISYKRLVDNYGKKITSLDAIGISAMMHGYLAFDKNYKQLVEFRTWRNTKTKVASDILTKKLKFHMPQRWSSVFYYQAVLNKEKHVDKVAHLFTLASYITYLLSGKNIIGIGDASGMFPIKNNDYDSDKIMIYNSMLKDQNVKLNIRDLLPNILKVGDSVTLTKQGAALLDPELNLKEGALICPPEGDMQTGMICTNSILERRASISCGTSANMTIVLEKNLKNYYDKIDVINTPNGRQVALIHTNNCTSEINKWVNLFDEVIKLTNSSITKEELFTKLFNKSLESDNDIGNLTYYNFLSGEPLINTSLGSPVLIQKENSKLNLSNFMQSQIYSAIATISLGLEILKNEDIKIESVIAHGGFYKTKGVAQIATSALLKAPVTVFESASEGGAYGIALLALYIFNKNYELQDFLNLIFDSCKQTTLMASQDEINKYNKYLSNFKKHIDAYKSISEVKND